MGDISIILRAERIVGPIKLFISLDPPPRGGVGGFDKPILPKNISLVDRGIKKEIFDNYRESLEKRIEQLDEEIREREQQESQSREDGGHHP